MIWLRLAVVLLFGLAGVMACRLAPAMKTEMDSGVVMRLPSGVDRFLGESGSMSEEEKRLLPEDTEMVRMRYQTARYGAGTSDQVEVTLVRAGAERRSIHRPEVCLTGQGWTLLNSTTVPIEISPGRFLKVKDLYIERLIQVDAGPAVPLRAHYLYWFVGDDVTTSSHAERIWLTAWDSVTRNVNHRWAYVSVLAKVTEGSDPNKTGERIRTSQETTDVMVRLIKELVPKIQKDWMIAERKGV